MNSGLTKLVCGFLEKLKNPFHRRTVVPQPDDRREDYGALIEILQSEERERRERQYHAWCDHFASEGFTPRGLTGGFEVHVELQPKRWLQDGLDLIDSRKGDRRSPLSDEYLPYPVFQMGAEIFLKGMWLYQHKECRELHHDSYISPEKRKHYDSELKNLSRFHDLLEIIQKVESIERYRRDRLLSRFLKIVGNISKQFYHPLMDDEKSWANGRYPCRFYNDSAKQSSPEFFNSYPKHILVSRLFAEATERVEELWDTESG